MIQDARVLQDEFIPKEVEHRDQKMNTLAGALDPVTRNEPAETVFLFGPSGSGKTCLARFALDRLREAVIDLNHQYVNCWQDYTRFRALYRILEAIGPTTDIHRQSTPTDALLERLHAYDGPEFVVILDEVDQLHDDDLLYDLYRTAGISMILIANREEELFAQLDNRLVSRLHASRRIRFEKYELDELVSILEDRVRWGLAEDGSAATSWRVSPTLPRAMRAWRSVSSGVLRARPRRSTPRKLISTHSTTLFRRGNVRSSRRTSNSSPPTNASFTRSFASTRRSAPASCTTTITSGLRTRRPIGPSAITSRSSVTTI